MSVTESAAELCDYLNQHVLDEELALTHLLDALASCELTLAEDPAGEASDAYIDLIRSVAGI